MKSSILFSFLFVLLELSNSGLALAAHGRSVLGHVGVGVYLGVPYPYHYYPYPYYYPYSYYPPPVMVAPPQPPVYIEQGGSQPSEVSEDYYWYHCSKPEGYYPYIKECPDGWQKVSPTPPQQ